MIVAPRVIRPGQVVQVSITILKLYHTHINVRGSIRMGSEEFASFNERFTSPSTRTTQMQVCFLFCGHFSAAHQQRCSVIELLYDTGVHINNCQKDYMDIHVQRMPPQRLLKEKGEVLTKLWKEPL